jgi:hypothetical protein
MIRIALLFIVAFSAANAAFADELRERAAAPTVTIDQLLKSPQNFADKFVRVSGQVDNCIDYSCNLCPEDMTNDTYDYRKCLGLEFDRYEDSMSGNGVSELMEQAFRFAIVAINTKFDPTCLANRLPYEPAIKGKVQSVVVCTDRATVLKDARVEAVHGRKSALDGIVSYYDFGPVKEPTSDAERNSMLAAMADVFNVSTDTKVAVFLTNAKEDVPPVGFEAMGLGCFCTTKSCDGQWPKRYIGGMESVGNPFVCWSIGKKNGRWLVLPH